MKPLRIVFSVLLLVFLLGSAPGSSELLPAPAHLNAKTADNYGKLPLYFIENQGQIDSRVAYYIQGREKSVFFTPLGVTFVLSEPSAVERWTVSLDFVGANPNARLAGREPTEAIFSYFKGPAAEWRTGLPTYAGVVYEDLWPGIDLVYGGGESQLKYEFIVEPGADPGQIRLAYSGAEVGLTEAGQLAISTPLGGFHDDRPYAYQESGAGRIEIATAYRLDESAVYGFEIENYDPSLPLIIDPAVAVYFAYIGGEGHDRGDAIALDAAGNSYITGETMAWEEFPSLAGPDLTQNGMWDAFIVKLNPAGTSLIYAGFIGGSSNDYGRGVAVDSEGHAYVVGNAWSSEETFPVVGGPDLTYNGKNDAFIAKLNAAGTALIYSGYIGGTEWDRGEAVVLDNARNAYLVGSTDSTEDTFPAVGGPDLTANGDRDVFVAKVDASGTALVYAGYIGGASVDIGRGIGLDNAGNVYVTGQTESGADTFPVVAGPYLAHGGGIDAFVARVNASGTALDYCGYIGGSEDDWATGIAVDDAGSAYVTGSASSREDTFPVITGPDLTHNGLDDAFVAKVNAAGSGLVYSGYVGGVGVDRAHGIAVDSDGHAYLTGFALSDQDSFPVAGGPDLIYGGGSDAFVAKLLADGSGLEYAGYVGGPGEDQGNGIAVDAHGGAYIVGTTISVSETISAPVTLGQLHGPPGYTDAFAAKIATTPIVSSVTSAASYIPMGLPGGGIAQGSLFTVFGYNMGPDTLMQALALPLATEMAGTSIEISVGGVTANAPILYTSARQLAGILPSTIPVGEGTLTVIYSGETSPPAPIRVAPTAFGIFTRNQAGTGPAVVQNWISHSELPHINSLIDSAMPNQIEILWGTGLGKINGDDASAPPPGDLDVDVQVMVGMQPATIQYKGRSPQFAGVDVIQFVVPEGVEGCYVPVTVIAGGVVGSSATMSITANGGICSDSISLTAADLARVAQGQETRIGSAIIMAGEYAARSIDEGEAFSSAGAQFGGIEALPALNAIGPMEMMLEQPQVSLNSCAVYQAFGDEFGVEDHAPIRLLDAGDALTLSGPFGNAPLERDDTIGAYLAQGGGGLITPGIYMLDNGSGTQAVGPFQAAITIPSSPFAWTNRDAIQSVPRTQPLTINWTGGEAGREVVAILGYSVTSDNEAVGSFVCAAPVEAGTFTVPVWNLAALPATPLWDIEQEGDPPSGLVVARMSRLDQNRFTATGLDVGLFGYVFVDFWVVPYE